MKFYIHQILQTTRKARIAMLLLLICVFPGTAAATVYQCLTQDGVLFLTNDRDNFPAGCEEAGEPIGEESATLAPKSNSSFLNSGRKRNIQQGSSAPSRSQASTSKAEEARSESPDRTTEAQANIPGVLTHKKEMTLWRGLAQRMANQYNALQNSTESPAEKAEKFEKLEKSMIMLREGLATSPISAEEAAEIEAKLPPL